MMTLETTSLNDEQIIHLFQTQLPLLLERRPDLEPQLLQIFFKTFARKDEVVAVWQEIAHLREEMRANFAQVEQRFDQVNQQFAQVEQRFDQVDQRFDRLEKRQTDLEETVKTGFTNVERQLSRLGSRWGIHTEQLLRQTLTAILTESFGVTVTEQHLQGEQFDILIKNGEHILVEITASAKRNIKERLLRKQELYFAATGITPSRTILAVGSINPKRYNQLIEAGIEVILPDHDDE